jgi:nicotinate-nucleotide adenylyltransferase
MIVGVFGGSFNPPHVSHVLACALVLSTEPFDKLLVVPAYKHPFAKSLAEFEDRAAMCELAMGWLPKVEVSRVEQELGGESRTVRTLEHLKNAHPDWELRLVIGADILNEATRWFGFDRIKTIAPLCVLGRRGHEHADAPMPILPEISSTEVRTAIAEKRAKDVAHLVPRAVLEHIDRHALYRS